jgi:hypothetical protein
MATKATTSIKATFFIKKIILDYKNKLFIVKTIFVPKIKLPSFINKISSGAY